MQFMYFLGTLTCEIFQKCLILSKTVFLALRDRNSEKLTSAKSLPPPYGRFRAWCSLIGSTEVNHLVRGKVSELYSLMVP